MNRRTFLQIPLAAALFPWRSLAAERSAGTAAEQAHQEILRRFLDAHGIMLDFTALDGLVELPTPEECRAGKPNALGWFSPIENGAMFNGLYMDAAVLRWQQTKQALDAEKARRIMQGLLLLSTVSDVPGFIARGVGIDGKSHFPMGSNDQTVPWFYGLWRYLQSGLATEEERSKITTQLALVGDTVVSSGWRMPAEPPFQFRGGCKDFDFDGATRLLFITRLMQSVTGDEKWEAVFQTALKERGGKEKRSRLELCERGMVFWYAKYHSWTSCVGVASLRALWEIEPDDALRAAFARGLQASSDLALGNLAMAQQFHPESPARFSTDWRSSMLPFWQPQTTEKEAEDVAHRQLREFMKASPRREMETAFVREPTAGAWVVTLAPDADILKQRRTAVEQVIAGYDYSKLYYSQFFWAESAWRRLQSSS